MTLTSRYREPPHDASRRGKPIGYWFVLVCMKGKIKRQMYMEEVEF